MRSCIIIAYGFICIDIVYIYIWNCAHKHEYTPVLHMYIRYDWVTKPLNAFYFLFKIGGSGFIDY